MLEIVNLISIGIASYNFKAHVASDIGIGNNYLPPENNIFGTLSNGQKNKK